MPIQILPKEESIAERLGTGLGAGLGSGLQMLAQQNLKNMLDARQRAADFEALKDYMPAELAANAVQADPQIRRTILSAALKPDSPSTLDSLLSAVTFGSYQAPSRLHPAFRTQEAPQQQGTAQQEEPLPLFDPRGPVASEARAPQEMSQQEQPVTENTEPDQVDPNEGFPLKAFEPQILGRPDFFRQEALKAIPGAAANLVRLPFALASGIASLAKKITYGRTPDLDIPEVINRLPELSDQAVENLIGQSLTPESRIEKAVGEGIRDTLEFLTPGLIAKGGKALSGAQWLKKAADFLDIPVSQAAKLSGIGNLSKFFTSELTGSERLGEAAKIGSLLAVPLIGSRYMSPMIRKNLSEAQKQLPPLTEVAKGKNAFKAVNLLNEAERDLMKVQNALKVGTGERGAVENVIGLIRKSSETKLPHIQDVFSINQEMRKMMEIPAIANKAKHGFKDFFSGAEKLFETSAKNKAAFTSAYDAYKELANANKIQSSVQNYIWQNKRTLLPRNPLVSSFIYPLRTARRAALIPFASMGMGAGEGERMIRIMAESPAFRSAYKDYLTAAVQQSLPKVRKSIKEMDKVADHFDKKR